MTDIRKLLAHAAAGLAMAGAVSAAQADQQTARAEFIDNNGEKVGKAMFTQGPHGVVVRLKLDGLPPGPKAIHIHHTGTCDDHGAGFKASGGHVNPDERQHGLLKPGGPGAGDFPNFYVHENGHAWAEMYNARISLDGSTGVDLLDDNGSAMVVHENPDDHKTQPIGGAGARIACAPIRAD